uniref:F-box/kelch-repeat protein At3g23880-like n=1 Tax=Nicotiana tabacum TaxID=4097 RepID=A0A1S3YEB7_TOBAC|nr:PREDICTED: F-box/kelch-repeat protein At3g23880-like [Nicotiana tabacum]
MPTEEEISTNSQREESCEASKQMDIVDHQATGIQFQGEIIMEILSRLPVRSLLQLKCVSNSWQALISDPYFKLKHLNHVKNNHKLLVCQSWFDSVDMERTIKFSFYSSPLSNVQQLDCPSTFKPFECHLFCCFNGLAVLGFFGKSDQQLFLWNPSTRESTLLPHSEFRHLCTMFGLGYDAMSDGYKILKWTMCQIRHSVEILSLKSGSWRKIWYYPTTIAIALGGDRNFRFILTEMTVGIWILWYLFMEHFIGLVRQYQELVIWFHLVFQMRCTERYLC